MDQKRRISRDWRIGFEIEVILDALGVPRFRGEKSMEIATPSYCQASAAILREATIRDWCAPRTTSRKHGFYVIPEYDIDPIAF